MAIAIGIPELDAALPGGGLARGGVHEWIGVQEMEGDPPLRATRAGRVAWSPPLTLLIEIAHSAAASSRDDGGRFVWIGEGVRPYAASLMGCGGSGAPMRLDKCLFVRAQRPADRLWATDLALRSRGAAVVIADGSGFDLAATRRLQLAAEAGGGLCLLARPPWERRELSAAATRWLVSDVACSSVNRRWTVELLRCKGLRPAPSAGRAWVLERDRATRSVRVVADVLDRPGETAVGGAGARRTG